MAALFDLYVLYGNMFLPTQPNPPNKDTPDDTRTARELLIDNHGEVELSRLTQRQLADVIGVRQAKSWHNKLRDVAAMALKPREDSKFRESSYRIVLTNYWPSMNAKRQTAFELTRREMYRRRAFDGGSYDRKEAAEVVGVTFATLHNWRKSGRLIAWQDEAGRYRFPVWQFHAGKLLPGLRECLEHLRGANDLAKIGFFVTAVERRPPFFRGREPVKICPIELLRAGGKSEAIALAADSPFQKESGLLLREDDAELTLGYTQKEPF